MLVLLVLVGPVGGVVAVSPPAGPMMVTVWEAAKLPPPGQIVGAGTRLALLMQKSAWTTRYTQWQGCN